MTNEQFKEIFKIQDEFNTSTNGKYWFLGIADNGKGIIWDLAYCMERAELLNWYNWKHWTDDIGVKNLNQVKIELTDMFHFVLSKLLELGYINLYRNLLSTLPGYTTSNAKNNAEIMEWIKKIDTESEEVKKAVDELYSQLVIASRLEDSVIEQRKQLEKQAAEAGRKLGDADFLSIVVNGVLGNTHTLAHERDASMQTYIVQEFYLLIAIAEIVYDFGVDELYKMYIGKLALNKLRQNNGYKTGKYKKYWSEDKEDNDYLVELVKDEDSSLITVDSIYAKLEDKYKTVK